MSDVAESPASPRPEPPSASPQPELPPASPRAATAADRTGLRALATGGLPGLDRLPVLPAVFERLAAALTASIRMLLGPEAEVRIDPASSVRLQEFQDRIAPGVPIAVLRLEPWGGRCLAVLDAGLTATAIEALLGGGGRASGDTGRRSYTAIERAVLQRLARDMIGRDLATAFALAGAGGFTVERLETDAAKVAIAKPSAPAIALRAEVALDGSIGCIEFLFPYAAIEPMRDRLSHGREDEQRDGDAAWRAHLMAELPHTNVRLRAVIEQRRVQAGEVLQWQIGSKLKLHRRHDEPIDVFCNDLLVLRGRIAEKDGHIALHIEERRIAEDWPDSNPQPHEPPSKDQADPGASRIA